MNRTEKQEAVETLQGTFRDLNSLFLLEYRGLKVVEETDIRKRIRDADGNYLVLKNRLALRAAQDTKVEALGRHFEGPTAVAYHPTDVVGLAKILTEVVKEHDGLSFRAALIEGKEASTEEIQALASLPSREALLGQLAFLFMAPMQKLAGVLQAPLRDLCLVLNQIKK